MTQKWNLQDIKPAPKRQRRTNIDESKLIKKTLTQRVAHADAEDTMSIEVVNGSKKKQKSLLYSVIIFFLVVGGGLLMSTLTGGADITVSPRHREPNVNATFTATQDPKPKELTYELMTLDVEGERQVSATGKEEVATQSEGTILIYNKHQKSPIRLVTNTRFESNGLIFRIQEPVIIPGYTKDDTGTIVPGVITADIVADQVGEQYNLTPSSFTIPGFTGEPEFDSIYAESIVSFTGGFDGMRFIIEDTELKTAQQALQMELRNSLLEKIDTEKPAGMVTFTDAVTFTYESLPSVEYGDDLATIKEKVTMRIPLFNEDNFASFITQATVPGYEGNPVRIVDTSVFKFSYTQATTSSSDISTQKKLSFKLAGRPQIVWTYDSEKLKADLVNSNKTALKSVLGAYPSIEKASAKIQPFWKTKFPIDLKKITIHEVID